MSYSKGDAETSVYCAKKAKPAPPLLFGRSMRPWLHLLSGNLLPSAALPAPKETPPLSPCSKATERVRACACVCVWCGLSSGDILLPSPFTFSSSYSPQPLLPPLSLLPPSCRSKILRHNYNRLVDMEDDMMLLCQNTRTYSQNCSQTLRSLCLPSLTFPPPKLLGKCVICGRRFM